MKKKLGNLRIFFKDPPDKPEDNKKIKHGEDLERIAKCGTPDGGWRNVTK